MKRAIEMVTKRVDEASVGQAKFWVVTDPKSAESELVDVMGNEPVTAIQLAHLILGGGSTLDDCRTRWESEHPEIYPEDKKAEAEADARERLENVTKGA